MTTFPTIEIIVLSVGTNGRLNMWAILRRLHHPRSLGRIERGGRLERYNRTSSSYEVDTTKEVNLCP